MIRDRASWVDPNYMGMQIGIGGLIGEINIFKYQKIDLLQKILSPIALAISIPAILITGSRGAALCLVAGVIIVLLSSNVKPIYKFLAVLVIGAFMVLLYNNSYFDCLEKLNVKIHVEEKLLGYKIGQQIFGKTHRLPKLDPKKPLH